MKIGATKLITVNNMEKAELVISPTEPKVNYINLSLAEFLPELCL